MDFKSDNCKSRRVLATNAAVYTHCHWPHVWLMWPFFLWYVIYSCNSSLAFVILRFILVSISWVRTKIGNIISPTSCIEILLTMWLINISSCQFALWPFHRLLGSCRGQFHPNLESERGYGKLPKHRIVVIGIAAANQYSVSILKALLLG